jgi:hypothetical protein
MELSPFELELGDAFKFVEPHLIVNQYRPLWKGENYVLVLIPAVYPSGAYRLFPYLLETRKDQLPILLSSLAEYLANIELGIYVNLIRAL